MVGQVTHRCALIRIGCTSLPLLPILLAAARHLLVIVFVLGVLVVAVVVRRRNYTFVHGSFVLLVHHFELRDGFLGLVDPLFAEVALPVDPACVLTSEVSLAPQAKLKCLRVVSTNQLLHDGIVFLMRTSLWMHLLKVGSILVESGLSVPSFIQRLPLLCYFLEGEGLAGRGKTESLVHARRLLVVQVIVVVEHL